MHVKLVKVTYVVAIRVSFSFKAAHAPSRKDADNYLVDVKFGVILDVEASRAIRQAKSRRIANDGRTD